MNLIWFLVRTSWRLIVISLILGTISGTCSVLLIALINDTINANHPIDNRLLWNFIQLLIVMMITGTLSQYFLVSLSQSAIVRLRQRLVDWILACPLRYLEELGANRLLATLTDDVDKISDSAIVLPFLFIDFALIIGCLAYLSILSWQIFLSIFIFLLLAVVVIQIFLTRSEKLMELAREQQDYMFRHFQTIIDGIKELKLNSYRRQAFVTQEFQVTAESRRRYNVISITLLGFTSYLGQLFFFSILGMLLFVAPKLAGINTTLLSGYALVITFLNDPISNILQMFPQIIQGNVAINKIQNLGLALASNSEVISNESINLPPAFHSLELVDVKYSYFREGEAKNFLLGPINLTFRPGNVIFIIGGNGSGKSSLAKLITGLYVPESGEILLDGKPITENNREQYRQLFSTVFSDFYLFERFFGISSDNLNAEAFEYLQKLQLEHKVEIKEGSLSTLNLSHGQRKRLALLTAYLEDRPIYLFDEWAADQDPYFREIFYKQLLPELKHQGKTILAITHDDRYFYLADKLIKLDYGKIVSR
ncbi:cyclic peptide export ABC transporter [Komarekiella sp. 'clone 1']|uniref:Cyclic peptide export ABC transporter n=1 Tax=Komarekiella delphini-convector SJRDD-AB1 TaxID=2593771 RepID=A0AA40SVI1_9NOST|nr:cyclic peptide export ABC transporter [Komarekiella delphini-convector]MBD6615685.1 cyclic peptide export ABC transporter [Komarekiella delphini-convector SJRDD-AB1]